MAVRRVEVAHFRAVGQLLTHFRNGEDNLLHRPVVMDHFNLRRVIGVVLQGNHHHRKTLLK